MLIATLILGLFSALSFGLGAAGVPAKVNWDQLGKCLAVLAALAYIGAFGAL